MKSNFHLETSKKNSEFHINLHGIFDGASAFELLGVIRDGEKQGLTMFIDTSHLKQALPFGRAILESNLPRNEMRTKLNFKGARAGEILPEGCTLLIQGHKNSHTGGHKCTGQCKNCRCRRAISQASSIKVS
ncbi:MAG: hypothetical protein HUN04_24725 [Desulfobacter sp.]|nr:MAG: hypothetical protein HUN04_24725 [Desulfobacter sp.]